MTSSPRIRPFALRAILALAAVAALLIALVALASGAPAAHAAAGPNPLATSPAPPAVNPLVGARWFVDEHWGLANRQARAWRSSHPSWAKLMRKIADQPEARRVGGFTPNIERTIHDYVARAGAESAGSVPIIVIYRLKHVSCGGYGDSPGEAASYKQWIDAFAQGVGSHRALIFLEPDGIMTSPCLSHRGLATRIAELSYATSRLSALPNSPVYVDAGAADALPYRRTADLLNRIGIARIQGFFLNSTHFDWTGSEIAFGTKISQLVGGKHFVVSTAANGKGPLVPHSRVKYGNELLCNPPGRGLGVRPTTSTASPLADAYLWIGNPGRSAGPCHPGDPSNGTWWPQYALGLAQRAAF
jgi:endoglucanase